MIKLPDYIVLDFLDWICQNYPPEKGDLDLWLNDKELVKSYAEKYLHEEYKDDENYDYKKCKRTLKRCINQMIDSKEFDEVLMRYCKDCNEHSEYCDYDCLHMCCHELIHFLYNKHKELRGDSKYKFKNIDSDVLVKSLYFYLKQNGIIENQTLLQYMVGYPSKDLSVILDFFNWLKEQDEQFKIYKMPKSVFYDEIIKKYETSVNVELNNRTKRNIASCFCNKSYEQIYKWFNKVFGKKDSRNLSYVFKRYYYNTAKYKCILLPLKGELELNKFVERYWNDLDVASSDSLDIFYSLEEFKDTGFASLKKISSLAVDKDKLPCIVIWQDDISEAKAIKIWKLDYTELNALLLRIIDCIDKGMNLEQIYVEALKMTEELKEDNKTITKIEQNINGSVTGAVIGVSDGTIENINTFYQDTQGIQKDIQQAKERIENIEQIDSEFKNYIFELLDQMQEAVLKNDNELKGKCISHFEGFKIGAGKVAKNMLDVLGSIASIASFFGM